MTARPAADVVALLPLLLSKAGLDASVSLEVETMPAVGDLPWLEHSDVVWVDDFSSRDPRRGLGRSAMAELCLLADANECRIALNPWAKDTPDALRQDQLEAFYLSMGFGWRRDHVMVREPWAQTTVHVSHDVPYQPIPNRSETILSRTPPPRRLTSTGFAVPLAADGSVLMASSRKPGRGIEIPGGHIERGERDDEAARREAGEETGAVLGTLEPIGHQRLISRGAAPASDRYPFPLAYQSFFAARLLRVDREIDDDECGPAVPVSDLYALKPHVRLLAMRARQLADRGEI